MKYEILVGSHTRFDGTDSAGKPAAKTYRVGDEIELSPEQAAVLNERVTRVVPAAQAAAMREQQAATEKLAAATDAAKPAARAKRG